MSDQGIIQGFQERRQIEDAILALGATTTEAELIAQTGELVGRFPADRLAAAIQRHLGDTNSQLRGGLGHLSALLPPEMIVPALRDLAANRQKTPIERMTALLILERYLGESVSPALTSDLSGNDDIAMQSLLEAVEEGRTNRHVYLEYVTQMQEHSVDVAFMVLGLLNRLAPDDRVEMLRLIAQDPRSQVARVALDRLTTLATTDGSDPALRALHTLSFTLPPALADQVQRSLRKLQFMGRRYQPPSAELWRALLSPADAGGYFNVWLVAAPTQATLADGVLLGFSLALHQGIVQCSGVVSMEAASLPPQRPIGQVTTIENGKNQQMLEISFEIGRWLVQKALTAHWRHEDGTDLPGEYKLYNDLLWQYAAPHLPERCVFIFDPGDDAGLAHPDMSAVGNAADALIRHPVMRPWIGWAASVWAMLAPEQDTSPVDHAKALIDYVLSEIDRLPQRSQFQENMAAALRIQALWLTLHGEHDMVAHAVTLARWMRSLPVRQNPLLSGLLQVGLSQTLAARNR